MLPILKRHYKALLSGYTDRKLTHELQSLPKPQISADPVITSPDSVYKFCLPLSKLDLHVNFHAKAGWLTNVLVQFFKNEWKMRLFFGPTTAYPRAAFYGKRISADNVRRKSWMRWEDVMYDTLVFLDLIGRGFPYLSSQTSNWTEHQHRLRRSLFDSHNTQVCVMSSQESGKGFWLFGYGYFHLPISLSTSFLINPFQELNLEASSSFWYIQIQSSLTMESLMRCPRKTSPRLHWWVYPPFLAGMSSTKLTSP